MIFRKTPLSSPCSVQPEFSSAARLFRAHHFYARRIHLSCISKSFCKLGCAVIYFIKPQTHGKSQHCEIFVNKAAEPRRKRAMPAGYCEKLASCVAAKSVVLLARVIWFSSISRRAEGARTFRLLAIAKMSAPQTSLMITAAKLYDFRGNPNGFPLLSAIISCTHIVKSRTFTPSVSRGIGK